MAEQTLSVIIQAIDRATGPFRKVSRGLGGLSRAAANVSSAFGNVVREGGALGLKLGVLAAGGAFVLKRQLIDTGIEFERFQGILESVEPSAEQARRSLAWVKEFSEKTPFNLEQTTEAFVRMRAYGLDPTNGSLETLGDTAAAMGRSILQPMEALADAITGENERLKELGITARVKGNRTAFTFTNKQGEQQTRIVDNRNRKIIESTLIAIWNEKYGGAMRKFNKTWIGMVSELDDKWTNFKLTILEQGLFDQLKAILGGLLKTVDQMAKDGTLKQWAIDIGAALKGAIDAATWFFKVFGQGMKGLADLVGGWERAMKIGFGAVAAIIAGPLILAIGSLGTALSTLLLNPFGLAIAAIIAGGVLLYKNWDSITSAITKKWDEFKIGFGLMWEEIKNIFPAVYRAIKSNLIDVVDALIAKWQKFVDFFRSIGVEVGSFLKGDNVKDRGSIVQQRGGLRVGGGLTENADRLSQAADRAAQVLENINANITVQVTSPENTPIRVTSRQSAGVSVRSDNRGRIMSGIGTR